MKMKGMTKFVVSVLTVFLLNYIKVICCHHRTHSREYVWFVWALSMQLKTFKYYIILQRKIKRSTMELYERYKRRRLSSVGEGGTSTGRERLVVSCHNSRRFRSARERWWFIAISNCNSPKVHPTILNLIWLFIAGVISDLLQGLDVRYKFLMTNGPDGDFWHKHFSADEFCKFYN